MGAYKNNLPLIAVIATIIIASVIYLVVTTTSIRTQTWVSNDNATKQPLHVSNAEVAYSFEPADTRQLVGFADQVFVGQVIEQVSEKGAQTSVPDHTFPRTQFSVKVLDNIKGDATGIVTVSQDGGYVEAAQTARSEATEPTRELILVEGDSLLKPSKTYLLSTAYYPEANWYQIAAQPYGNLFVKDQVQLEVLKEKFEAAKKAQIDPASLDPSDGSTGD